MTFVGVRVDAGRAMLRLGAGKLAPRVISQDATGAKVALVATTALLLGGDQVRVELDVGPGAWLEIIETTGTVAYDAHQVPSGWQTLAAVGDGALLLWPGEPFVVAGGANTTRSSTFDVGDRASLCVRETVVLGRTGENGGAVRVRTQLRDRNGWLLVEELDLTDRATRELPGVLGPATVIDTVTLLGAPRPLLPEVEVGCAFDLAGTTATTGTAGTAGTIGRALRPELAGSPASAWWSGWSSAARAAYRAGR